MGAPAEVTHSFQGGFSYIIVLIALTIFGLGLLAVEPRWSDITRRERESDLIESAHEIVSALDQYYLTSPTTPKQYPAALDALLDDHRFVGNRRYLRRIPFDPVNRSYDWGLVRDREGRIIGVFSKSDRRPLRSIPPDGAIAPNNAIRYDQWIFTASQEGSKI